MSYNKEMILDLYRDQASLHEDKPTSTIQDVRTRMLEIVNLTKYLSDGMRVLEVGCGNGYTAESIANQLDVFIHGVDFSKEMIQIAKKREGKKKRGAIFFEWMDILEPTIMEQYDVVFTERCLQNIMNWEKQKEALLNICKLIKPGGGFIMLESFSDAHKTLNEAREELGLSYIPVPYHNLMFDKELVLEFLGANFDFIEENRFLSGYYFGTRLLYPKLLPDGKQPSNQSHIKDYLVALPNAGDFCPMKILYFRKKKT